jgi:uncharacterized membrane protein
MEQANRPSIFRIIGSGLLAAIVIGLAHYFRFESTSAMAHTFGNFLTAIGWLLLIWTVVLMVLWAIKSVRS